MNGNAIISDLLQSDTNFSIVRCGIGTETIFSYNSKLDENYEKHHSYQTTLYHLHNNTGIYFHPKYNKVDIQLYVNEYNNAVKSCNYIGVWYDSWIHQIEKQFIDMYHLDHQHFKATDLEPYYFSNPWSKYLENKKVLIISPFTDTIEKQYQRRELLFENKDILPSFTLLTLKSNNTAAFNRDGDSWMDNFQNMCSQIDTLDFDVALLGCGGYGLPLVNYIKNNKKKSAIYIGGALQIMFGIKGRRWDTNNNINKFYNEYWVRPSSAEQINNLKNIEGGCYW